MTLIIYKVLSLNVLMKLTINPLNVKIVLQTQLDMFMFMATMSCMLLPMIVKKLMA